MIPAYTPDNWFWIVAGDTARYYSSAVRGYVEHLPAGAGVTRIASETELWSVLAAQYPDGLPETPERVRARFAAAIQAHLDAAARARGYDSILSCVSYAGGDDALYSAEGRAALAWRDAVWRHAFDALAAVQADQRPVPELTEFLAELPAIEWPA